MPFCRNCLNGYTFSKIAKFTSNTDEGFCIDAEKGEPCLNQTSLKCIFFNIKKVYPLLGINCQSDCETG